MFLTYFVYLVCIILVLWGIKFAGFSKFNEDFLDVDVTKALCGIPTLLIIIHHISQRDAFQYETGELSFFVDLGYLLVTIFFFYSGYGLTVNANNNSNYLKDFKLRRVLTVALPFFICNIVFAIVGLINGMDIVEALLGVFGLVSINPNGWYPIVLLIMYLVFYLSYKFKMLPSNRILFYFYTVLVLIGIFCFNGHFAWWSDKAGWWLHSFAFYDIEWWKQKQILLFSGEWWVNSVIAFVVGAYFATYKDKVVNFFKKGYWFKLLILILLFVGSYFLFITVRNGGGYWTEMGSRDPGIRQKFLTSFAQLPVSVLFIVTFVVLTMKFVTVNPLTKFLGKISYETYLYGVLSLNLFDFLINSKYGPIVNEPYHYNLIIYTICVIACTILIGFIFNKLDNLLINKIRNKLKK